ncbi:hypothetical protein AB6A23_05090 [Paenibacillus tarimensis]
MTAAFGAGANPAILALILILFTLLAIFLICRMLPLLGSGGVIPGSGGINV